MIVLRFKWLVGLFNISSVGFMNSVLEGEVVEYRVSGRKIFV